MGVEPPPSERRVAGETVPLGMAGDTALEALSSRLTMSQNERPFGVVVPRVERCLCGEAGIHVTAGTELTRTMAIATARLARIRRRRMAPKEAGRVVARGRVGRIWPMTVETLGAHMAAATGLGTGIGNRPVLLGEICPVRGRPFSCNHRTAPAPRSRGR
jgi:hypothetical protein